MIVVLGTWQEIVAEHAGSFLLGVGGGFVLANRYRITKRNGGDDG